MDRGAWWAAIYGVAQSRACLKWLIMHTCIGGGNGNPLQYSCLENPRDRGAWWAAIYRVAKSRTDWSDLAAETRPLRGCEYQRKAMNRDGDHRPQAWSSCSSIPSLSPQVGFNEDQIFPMDRDETLGQRLKTDCLPWPYVLSNTLKIFSPLHALGSY